MSDRSFLAVVLAAGEGTRMKSSRAKVLHEVGGRSLLGHVIDTVKAAGADRLAVVVGPDMRNVAEAARADWPDCGVFVQEERKGTAHAVLAARAALKEPADDVIVLYGDTPLVAAATLQSVRAKLAAGADLVVLGFEPEDPAGYGRLIVEDGTLVAIREDRDADPAERGIRLCNSGIMGFRGTHLPALLDDIGCDNAKHEFYLTDAVEIARGQELSVVAAKAGADEVMGINDRAQLAECEAVFQARKRADAMAAGVTLIAPETVFFSHDTALSADVVVEPNVVFGPGVAVASGARVRAFSHLEGASVAENAQIGPYARLRPGAEIGAKARVGNFVEIKKAVVDEGAKVNHLTYIGDAHIGAAANIGAGTITCNYDGFNKYHTEIGAGAFIGSNSSLVAPVTIGDGAYVGSGSVVTEDVEKDALAIGRGRQVTKAGRGADLRDRLAAEKASRK
ncbi:bifunctional UDP-N-acetylglucosamine diphosphorylase/glucosamine-1-phosphate N-acetyltransferase GlmU [Rhodobium gokarnense]|uniref:Bifunctional protein GlmU n=1 Tax=Rhodobium gokarnense TaxID=364296 RepID=A0ABT3HB26_9HYPH|nr:bifunctional UDP-N-acetylglucosamine diphosphorylase/glucosamine-1-phosphate N-acetyltransferase GlmU [Rhodobium gokarnense]MCW2307600.1 bifunctional UDP-N-acetylglucosamine pyrophosphorylase/glucosamine-1-phosphate N-acetyltransferase [Rhodobium gokarnense]